MLRTKYDQIKAQLQEVEDELEERRRERAELDAAKKNKTMPRGGGGGGDKAVVRRNATKISRNPKTTFKKKPAAGKSKNFTVSKSARAYLDAL